MSLNIDRIQCLVVEDDKFKMDGIRSFLLDKFGDRISIVECHALASASAEIDETKFDLAIIDMSIHSHQPEAGAGSPVPLPSGGLDVLFELNYSGMKTRCIILTQYPDIPIEGEPIPVELAAEQILQKFEIGVAGCVRYFEGSQDWRGEVSILLEGL